MILGDADDRRIRQDLTLFDGAPCLRDRAELPTCLAHGALLEIRMELDLVDRRGDVRRRHELIEVMRFVVRNADGPNEPLLLELLEGTPTVGGVGRLRPVDEVQVDVVDTEPSTAVLERSEPGLIALVAVPQLRGDEDLVTREPGPADAFTTAWSR